MMYAVVGKSTAKYAAKYLAKAICRNPYRLDLLIIRTFAFVLTIKTIMLLHSKFFIPPFANRAFVKHFLLGVIPYFLIGVVFYILDRQNVFICDDLFYAMNHKTGLPVESIFDAFQSQTQDWFSFNGRFFVHFIVQCFCGFIPLEVFYLCNTLVFLVLLRMMVLYVRRHTRQGIRPLGILLLLSVFLLPPWGLGILGNIAFSVNYLWAGCAYLAFLLWFEKQRCVIPPPQ